MEYPKVVNMALHGATMASCLKWGRIPRWLLKFLLGENFIWNMDEAEKLLSDNEYAIQISKMIKGEK